MCVADVPRDLSAFEHMPVVLFRFANDRGILHGVEAFVHLRVAARLLCHQLRMSFQHLCQDFDRFFLATGGQTGAGADSVLVLVRISVEATVILASDLQKI